MTSIRIKLTSEEHREAGNTNNDDKCLIGQRHILAFMGFLALLCMFSMQVNLSVAIVAMAKTPNNPQHIINETCPIPLDYLYEPNSTTSEEFVWNEKTQGLILGSFFYLYGVANIIGGRASEYFGGRLVVGFGIIVSAILTLLSPVAARTSSGFFIALRALEGCFQGLSLPAMNSLLAKWYTTKERSQFTSFIFAGSDFGNVLTLAVSGWLCASEFLGGWPSVFYIPSILTLLWGILWFLLIRDDPRQHPRISKEELKYIEKGCPDSKERCPVPWRSIFTSRYFWTIVVTQVGSNWGYSIILTELPTYLDKILHVQIRHNGNISASLFLGSALSSVVFGTLTGKAIAKGYLSVLSVRRLAMIISGYGPMLCMVAMCFVNCNETFALTVLLIIGVCNGAAYCGIFSSHADIAPRFAGTLMGLSTAIGSIACFSGPALAGFIIEGNQTISAWRTVFLICASVYGVSTTVYEIFITTERQSWNEPINIDKNDEILETENVPLNSASETKT